MAVRLAILVVLAIGVAIAVAVYRSRSSTDAGLRSHDSAGGAWPEGQISHVAGPTDGGFRVIDVWESREAFECFEREVLAPLGFAGAPATEFAVHKVVVTDSPES